MATALIRHLIRQGEYSSNNIALLTPYTGQLRKLKTSLSRGIPWGLSNAVETANPLIAYSATSAETRPSRDGCCYSFWGGAGTCKPSGG